ncbi:MAG: hypothetical protein M1338_02250, partial [Patescibacteria group bacterium]|nr:hypothetical protein [Patescibacteria group bacterium]
KLVAGLNNIKELTFPADYDAHLDYQAGWYFFAGNFTDQNGNPVDILVNFFHRSMYPLDIANKIGLTEANNQIVEVQLGLSLADKGIHVQGSNPTIAATTGMVKFSANPFSVQVGKNIAQSQQPNELFPMKIQVSDPEQNLNIDLTLEKANPVLLEGKNGQAPSMYNLGTWYYSFPNIKTTGTVSLGDDTRDLSGKMWMDNQWTAGIMPAGYADNIFIRALSNILNWYKGQTPQAWGWDWVEAQFDDNTGVTISSMHSVQSKDLNNLGENPPGDVTRDAYGKYINTDGSAEDLNGKLTINKWVKSPASGAWFPNGWVLDFPSKNLNFTMTPTVDGQLFQTKSSAEFREGGVIITGKRDGQDIAGVGFGEGVGYAGEDYYYKTFFKNLGINDTPENRDLYSPHIPGFWLVVESLLLYAIPLAIVIYMIVLIFKKFRRAKK